MKNTAVLILTLAAIAMIASLVGCQDQGRVNGNNEAFSKEERSWQLKLASSFNSHSLIHGESIRHLVDRLETASNGTIKIKVYDPGKLVAAFKVLDAVSAGKVEAGFSTPGYWMGKIPAAPLFSATPFGPDASEYLSWFLAGNGMKLYQEMYDRYGFNVKVILCAIIPPDTSGWFAQEILSVDDLKGLKIRYFGLGGNVLKKLGATVNLLPGGEIFPALEKGVIDATEFALPSIDEDMGFYKIVKYNYYPGWHQQASAHELLINKDVWNQISPQQKSLIELACRDTLIYSLTRAEASQSEVMLRNERERGVKNVNWSTEMLKILKKTWEEVAAEQSAADPFFKKVYDDYSEFRKNYAVWGSKAYLPRPSAPL